VLLTCAHQVLTKCVRFDTSLGASAGDDSYSAPRDDCDPGGNAGLVKVRSLMQIVTLQKAYNRNVRLLKWPCSSLSCFTRSQSAFLVQGPEGMSVLTTLELSQQDPVGYGTHSPTHVNLALLSTTQTGI
jgi:hypothetical protein